MPSAGATVSDCGVIRSIQFPAGWTAAGESRFAGRRTFGFYPESAPQARFSIILRDEEISAAAADAFQETLYSPFHNVDAAEMKKLAGLVETMSDPAKFELYEALVEYVNDRRALRIAGTWLSQPPLRSVSLFVDVEGNGRRAQQVSFTAPAQQFVALVPSLESIIQSIIWQR